MTIAYQRLRATPPTPRTTMVGRTGVVAAARALLLDDAVPLLTLTGPGGVGKTRVAMAVAADVSEAFADGVAFVALAPIRDPALVLPTIAEAVGVGIAAAAADDALPAALRDRHFLLVLDNLEQVVAAASLLGDLLVACPRLQILATSRTRLRLRSEHQLPIPPLPTAGPKRPPTLDAMAAVPAVTLFLQRTRQIHPEFELTADNAPAVAAIVDRLDGLPLAIELAAARLGVLSPNALLALLDHRLRVLTGGAPDLPPRLRTMADAIAWSHDLLGPDEQALFRRLAVFVGGFTSEAGRVLADGNGTEAPPAGAGDRVPSAESVDLLATLVDHSLIHRVETDGDEPRFAMLETIREFALERLRASGEEGLVSRVHASHFLGVAEAADALLQHQVHGPAQSDCRDRLDAEHANFRTALGWSERNEPELALALVGALARFWLERHGYLVEARDWLDRVLLFSHGTATEARAKVLMSVAEVALTQGDVDLGVVYGAEAVALYRGLDDEQGLLRSLHNLAWSMALQGEIAGAIAAEEEMLVRSRRGGHPRGICLSLIGLAWFALRRGDHARAEDLAEEGATTARRYGDPFLMASAAHTLGEVARVKGNLVAAADLIRHSLRSYRELGMGSYVSTCLVQLAGLPQPAGDRVRAARVAGAAAGLLAELGGRQVPLLDPADHARVVLRLRLGMGEPVFRAAYGAGFADPWGVVFQEAEVPSNPGLDQPAPSPRSSERSGLTARERQILVLLERRLTDREIADALFLSRRTVNAHVSHILTKLGVTSRRHVVERARELGVAASGDGE